MALNLDAVQMCPFVQSTNTILDVCFAMAIKPGIFSPFDDATISE